MKLWIIGDMHLDCSGNQFDLPSNRPDFDVLVIPGDICEGIQNGVNWIKQQNISQPVIYVPGNHEYYRHDMKQSFADGKAACEGTNIHLLDEQHVVIDNVEFIGATLWTDYALYNSPDLSMMIAKEMMNDHRYMFERIADQIIPWTPEKARRAHNDALWYLDYMASAQRHVGGEKKEADRARVVVSHHAPSEQSISSMYLNSSLNPAFVSNLEWMVERFDLWIHGHTHSAVDYTIGKCRVINNPRGYRNEATNFDPYKIVTI